MAVGLLALGVLGASGAALLAKQRADPLADSQLVRAGELSYRVPAGWSVGAGGPETVAQGFALDGVASGSRYFCGGERRSRVTVGATFLARGDGVDASPEAAVRDFGPLFASGFYGPGSPHTATAPAPVSVGDRRGFTSTVSVRAASTTECPRLRGQVRVYALPSESIGASGGRGVLLFVIQRDTQGGPAEPPPVPDRLVSAILGSVRVGHS